MTDWAFYQNIGSLAAFPFAPLVVDTLGRRPAILGGAMIMLAATALQTASWNVEVFIGARFACIPFVIVMEADSNAKGSS